MMAALHNQNGHVTLKNLLADMCVTEYLPDVEVMGLTLDSRQVEAGYVFVALEGHFEHGLAYAEAAVSRGAIAVLCDAQYDQYCQQILSKIITRTVCVPVKGLASKLADIANRFYDAPSEKLFVSGITGTDGKTSVSHFIAQAMQQQEVASAVIGTLGNGVLNDLDESTHTTPDILNLHNMLARFVDKGVGSVAMEVSSHGLDQNRVDGVKFDVAVLTNLSRDHLDYHGSIDNYKKAKRKLFADIDSRALVLNIDDEFGFELYDELKLSRTIWLYGAQEARAKQSEHYAYATHIETQREGIKFMLNSSQGTAEVQLKLLGDFNVYNALACFCVLLHSGLNFNLAIQRLQRLNTVPGRMETIAQPESPLVVIDYAHTPEALSQALRTVRKHTQGKIICVFGCGGDRDAGKRPLMAKVAEAHSDLVILTSDNPRNEDPVLIIDEIKQGVSNELKFIVEPERKKAIQQAIAMASTEDLILIAGKGHETVQIIGNRKIPFSDKQEAMTGLGAYK